MRRPQETPYREPTLRAPAAGAWRPPVGALLVATLVLLSSCCYGNVFAVLALCVVAVIVPCALVTHATGRSARARRMAVASGFVAAGALLAFLVDRQKGAALAVRNERLIIPAVDRFRADHGRYPDSLSALVPRYLPSTHPAGVPLPLYRIEYWRHADDATLIVTVVAPFGRRTWNFKQRRAGFLD